MSSPSSYTFNVAPPIPASSLSIPSSQMSSFGRPATSPGFSNASSTAATTTRRPTVVACENCRRRKVRCDGQTRTDSTCRHCREHGYACIYPTVVRKRGRKPGYLSKIENRINDFQNSHGFPFPRFGVNGQNDLTSQSQQSQIQQAQLSQSGLTGATPNNFTICDSQRLRKIVPQPTSSSSTLPTGMKINPWTTTTSTTTTTSATASNNSNNNNSNNNNGSVQRPVTSLGLQNSSHLSSPFSWADFPLGLEMENSLSNRFNYTNHHQHHQHHHNNNNNIYYHSFPSSMAPQQQQPLKAHIKAYEAHVATSAAAGMIKEEDMSINDSSRSSKPVASPNERIFEDGRPPVAFVYEIASLLFSYPTNVLLSSCIHPSRFLQRLSNGQMEPFLQFALVINGTITLEHEMLSNLTNWESLRDELTIRAREDVDRRFEAFMEVLPPESSFQTIFELHQASNCLDVLHGYFLLALFSMRIGDIRQARKDLSAAMMLCEKFYLNNLDQVDPVNCATIYDPLISAEHFRRAFWGLYILDCFTTFFTDEFNIINERNICLRLPCHHLLWLHNDHSSVNEPLLNIENGDTPATPDTNIFLKQLVRLLTLSSRINRFVRLCADGGNFLGDAELEEFSQLEKSLNNWLSFFLPSSTGTSTANASPDDQNLQHELCHGDLLFLYTLHQTMLIILYKAHLRSKDSHKYHISTPFGLQAFKRVHRISRNLTQLLKQKHPLLQANGCTGAHPLLSFCLYHVCLVHLNVIYQKQIQIPLAERQLAEEQFNFGQKLILECYESWRIAERYYRILQEMNSTGLLEDFEGLGSLENVTFSSSLPKQQQVEGSLRSCSSIGSLALGDLDLSPVLSMPVVHRRNVSTSYTREINMPNKLPTMRSMSLIETFAMPPSLSLDRMCTSLEEIRPSTSIGVSHHEALSAYSLWGGDVAAAAAVAVAATGGAPGYAYTNHWVPLPGEGFVSPQSLHCDGLSRQASNHRLASAHTLLESDLDGDGGFLEEEINVLEINALNSDDNSNVVDSETDEKKSTRKKRRRQPNRKRN